MPPPEWIIPVATFLLGGALSLATWIFQRELGRSDDNANNAEKARHKLREEMDTIERESLKRDDALQRDLEGFRREAFGTFETKDATMRLEGRIEKLSEKLDQILKIIIEKQ